MNAEVYKSILATNVQNPARLIGKCFKLQQDNDPKHTVNSVKELIKAQKWTGQVHLQILIQSNMHFTNWRGD